MQPTGRGGYVGLGLALASGATFGLSGSFGKSLLDVGWSPLGIVLARLAGAAVLLSIPLVVVVLRGWRPRRAHLRPTLGYGVFAIAGTQLFFFNAVQYLPVGVALLLEFLAPVLLLFWVWWRTGRPPSALTSAGAAVAIGGLVLVLDIAGDTSIDPLGVAWGLGAAVCVCVYFQAATRDDSPPPLVLTTAGMYVGAVALGAVGLLGLLPMEATTSQTVLAGEQMPWWAVVALIALVSTSFAYLSGIMAIGRLGSRIASFVGLSEVLCAVLGAWWLVGQQPTLPQLIGGILVVAGIAVIRYAERPRQRRRTKTKVTAPAP